MARISMLAGASLVVVGIVVTAASESESATSLIPAFVGVVLLLLGLAARARPAANRHFMHAAAAVSLLALLGSLGSLIGRGAGGWALAAQLATVAITGVVLAMAIRSFRAARRDRDAAGGAVGAA